MKRYILVVLAVMGTLGATAQENPIRIVFDVSSENPEVHRSAARHLRLMSESYPQSQFEMVVYGGAVEMIDRKRSVAGETLAAVAGMENVNILVCQQTLNRHNMGPEDLIPGVGTVPDGIYQIVARQQEGWGYIKEVK